MKKMSFVQKSVSSLFILLAVFNPGLQASTISVNELIEDSVNQVKNASPFVTGQLDNGLTYSIVKNQSNELTVRVSTRTSGAIEDKDNLALALLTAQSSLYGTQDLSQEYISSLLNQLGLDVDGSTNVTSTGKENILQFTLSADDKDSLTALISFMQQASQQASLSDEAVERAKMVLISKLTTNLAGFNTQESQDEHIITSKDLINSIAGLTAVEVRDFYNKWYRPDLTYVSVSGNVEIAPIQHSIETSFAAQSTVEATDPAVRVAKSESTRSFKATQSHPTSLAMVEHPNAKPPVKELSSTPSVADVGQVSVIDGKIWMKDPNWINNSENGWWLGASMLFLGTVSAVAAFFFAPLALIAPVVFLFTPGIYFYLSPYMKDPEYVKMKRAEDLKKGFHYAYSKGRAAFTLTPFERRQMFITEMLQNQVSNNSYGITLLADTYDLSDSVFTPMFYTQEIIVLAQVKKDFITDRNNWKTARAALENELYSLTRPFREQRDYLLDEARAAYEQSYYVATKNGWKSFRDSNVEAIENDFVHDIITCEERNSYIEQEELRYDLLVNEYSFAIGLDQAKEALYQRQNEINALYEYNVSLIKMSINYDNLMNYYMNGENTLYAFFNSELMYVLAEFPIIDYTIADWVDLRFQQ